MHALQACLFKFITVAAFCFYLRVVKMLLKGEVGGHALKSHGNYIVDHGKSWDCVFEFLWEPWFKHVFWCSKELPHPDSSFEYPQDMFWLRNKKSNIQLRNSYTMGCPPVRGDNPRALASGLSYVQEDKHGITILYHLHQCRPSTS